MNANADSLSVFNCFHRNKEMVFDMQSGVRRSPQKPELIQTDKWGKTARNCLFVGLHNMSKQ